jgi:cysteine synthase
MIFNQFEEFGNYLWHYEVTGHAMEEVLKQVMGPNDRYRGMASATGSAGTIASGDYMKNSSPKARSSPAKRCNARPCSKTDLARTASKASATSMCRGFTTPRTPMVVAIDDNAVVNISRLFNEENGRAYLVEKGVPEALIANLDLLGFSGISNVLSCDQSRQILRDGRERHHAHRADRLDGTLPLAPARDAPGIRSIHRARRRRRFRPLPAWQSTDNMLELRYTDRRRVHNLKYYTWVEQQGKTYEEIQAQWYEPITGPCPKAGR